MIRPESLEFAALHCSLDPMLGDYYQDLTGAIALVESGYHGGLDDDGVPWVNYPGQGRYANAVTIAQYALANISAHLQGEPTRASTARIQLDWLVAHQQQVGELAGCWVMLRDSRKYPWLRAPWTSAMASGNAISALLRGWELFGNDAYRTAAEHAYEALHSPRPSMELFTETRNDLWYEEYPAKSPLHVLNGHIYSLLGVLDIARVTGDQQADGRWRQAAGTALAHLDAFDLGYWSAYDLRFREPVTTHYQKNVHVPQLRVLTSLTGEPEFARFAERWERQLHSRTSAVRRWAAPRLSRLSAGLGRNRRS